MTMLRSSKLMVAVGLFAVVTLAAAGPPLDAEAKAAKAARKAEARSKVGSANTPQTDRVHPFCDCLHPCLSHPAPLLHTHAHTRLARARAGSGSSVQRTTKIIRRAERPARGRKAVGEGSVKGRGASMARSVSICPFLSAGFLSCSSPPCFQRQELAGDSAVPLRGQAGPDSRSDVLAVGRTAHCTEAVARH